jgi:ArsR family transcriptional regulator
MEATMTIDFARGTLLLKAMADETRARILHILTCGELCACELLDYFDLTQPTLSHHLGVLVEAGLVKARTEGKWTHYSLSAETFEFLDCFIKDLSRESERCLCKKTKRSCK